MLIGQGEHLRRLRRYQDRSIQTGSPLMYPVAMNIDPTKIRHRIKERCKFTCYNTGNTMAYITVSRCYWRKTLDKARPVHILGTVPANYTGGPTFGTTYATVSSTCKVMSHSVPANLTPQGPNTGNSQAGWEVNLAFLGSDDSANIMAANYYIGRSLHAKQQFNPWVLDRYWYRGAGMLGSGGIFHAGGIVPYTSGTPIVGDTWYQNLASAVSYNPVANTVGSMPVRDGDANFSTTNGLGTGYSSLPNYDESQKGPLDRVFKRYTRKIKLSPGQSYTFSTSSRLATFDIVRDGYFATSYYAVGHTPATLTAGNPDSTGTWWSSSATADSTAVCYPPAPYVYGRGAKTRTQFVSFAIRGNTTVTSAGITGSNTLTGGTTIQENGPAQVLIKRQYTGYVKTWMKKPDRCPMGKRLDVYNDTSTTVGDYKNMYPTSAPTVATYAGIS